jgi:hypothetical protein
LVRKMFLLSVSQSFFMVFNPIIALKFEMDCFLNRFYCDSSSGLDEHNRTHTSNTYIKSSPEQLPVPTVPISTSIKSLESVNGTHTTTNNSEKSTPPSKAKVHRCRQCSFVSSVKVCHTSF